MVWFLRICATLEFLEVSLPPDVDEDLVIFSPDKIFRTNSYGSLKLDSLEELGL